MAVNINNRGGIPGAAPPVASDINVTPLVDVMLVLLIVFMVASQLAANGVKVDLPKSNAHPLTEPLPPVVVTIDAQGQVYVNQDAVDGGSLVAALARHTGGDKERRVHLRGDQKLSYGLVVKTMGQVTDAGYSRIALVSETPLN